MVIIRCDYFLNGKDFGKAFEMLSKMASTGLLLLPPGYTLLNEGPVQRGEFVGLVAKAKPDPEDPKTSYIETDDGLRLIFRDGKYAGWYSPNLAEPLN